MTGSRLDKWLFCARLYRTRLLAQTAASAGKIRINGAQVDRPGRAIKPGDVLTLWRGTDIVAVKVVGLAERRGSASEARNLYEILK